MITLLANNRETLGKKNVELINQGRIPAVVYGQGLKNNLIDVDEKEFKKVLKEVGESSLVDLLIGKEKKPVLVQEIQKDPVTGKVIHIDNITYLNYNNCN